MRRCLCVLAVLSSLIAGCATRDDVPTWQRPGLTGGRLASSIGDAMKQTDEEMKMSCDRERSTSRDADR
jgi:hypothetical protein